MKLLFDIGATKTRLAVTTDDKTLGEALIFDTDSSHGGQAELIKEARRLVGDELVSLVAGGAPGTVDRIKGRPCGAV
jgi:hypothetical protein